MNQLQTITNNLTQLQPSIDFTEVVARFVATRKSERTRKTYQTAFNQYAEACAQAQTDPLKGDSLITFSQALNERRRDQGGDLSNDTIRAKLKAIQSFFSWAYGYNLTPLTPQMVKDLITMPPARKLSPRDILTEAEVKALLGAIGDNRYSCRDRCLIRLMLDGGLRISEALALRAIDIYSSGNRFYVHVASGKGDKSRDVEIPEALYGDLVDCMQLYEIDISNPKHEGRRLFAITRKAAYEMLVRTSTRANLAKRVSPHSLRHTHAHHLRLLDWPIEAIGERLGHSSLETTKLYTRPAEMAQAVKLPALPWQNS